MKDNRIKRIIKRVLKGLLIVVLVLSLIFAALMGYRHFKLKGLPGNAKQYSMNDVEETETSLKGKNILFLGSSVTYGFASFKEAIPEYFAKRLGANITKEAVSGTTLVDSSRSSYVSRLLKKVDKSTEYDLVVVQLSTNDATMKKDLGELSSSMDIDSFDTKTITGAIEYIIAYVNETWHCPVAFFTGSYYDSPEYSAMVTRLLEIQKKWGICVLDLYTDEEFNDISDELRSLYMSDDIHPTKAGYKVWWCPELERQLFDYLNN